MKNTRQSNEIVIQTSQTGYSLHGQLPSQVGADIYGEAEDNLSGSSVAMSADGSRVAIGALGNDGETGRDSGHVRVFEMDGSNGWVQIGQDIDGESFVDFSGDSVAMSADGSRVAIGAKMNDGENGQAKRDQSGNSVAMSADGSRVAIGALSNNGVNGRDSGHVRVVEMDGSNGWVQIGQDIDGEAQDDLSGISVAMAADGSRVAIGALSNNGETGRESGHVRVFEMDGRNGWVQIGQDIDGESSFDRSGRSVAMSADGSRVAISAQGYDGENGSDNGHVRVFEMDRRNGWVQVGQDIEGESVNDRSGASVAMSADGSRVAIGSQFNNGENGPDSGHVRVFEMGGSNRWAQIGQDIDGEFRNDLSGRAVAMSADGSRVAIGAARPRNRTGQVRVYEAMKKCQ